MRATFRSNGGGTTTTSGTAQVHSARDAILFRALNLARHMEALEGLEDVESVDQLLTRTEMLYYHCVSLDSRSSGNELDTVVEKLRSMVDILSAKVTEMSAVSSGFAVNEVRTGMPGRPKFMVTESQLLYFVEHGFTSVDMSRLLGVSERTIWRRLREFNIESTRPFSAISDLDLDNIVKDIKERFPNAGYRMMLGHLKSRGQRVQQMRVRASMRRTDPEGTILRWFDVTERREYKVSGPNALWHIDGNHKLIR